MLLHRRCLSRRLTADLINRFHYCRANLGWQRRARPCDECRRMSGCPLRPSFTTARRTSMFGCSQCAHQGCTSPAFDIKTQRKRIVSLVRLSPVRFLIASLPDQRWRWPNRSFGGALASLAQRAGKSRGAIFLPVERRALRRPNLGRLIVKAALMWRKASSPPSRNSLTAAARSDALVLGCRADPQ